MSTFIVRFHALGCGAFSGEARVVSTGETIRFASATQLLGFFEEMHALPAPAPGATRVNPAAATGSVAPQAGERSARQAARGRQGTKGAPDE